MTAQSLLLVILSFTLAPLAKAVSIHPSASISSDATQSEVLSQIDKGVLDFNPSISSPNWVIYPEDQPKIGVIPLDRQTKFVPEKLDEADPEFGDDPDVDDVLVK